ANPHAAVVFYWSHFERQVRVEGTVEMVSNEESNLYWRTRPYGSQLGAWASPQSQVLPGREGLEQRLRDLELTYREGNVPRPPNWGGFRVVPQAIEFWQG